MTDEQLLRTAGARIREHRMQDAEVVVQTRQATPVADARVTIEQTRHEVLFGCNFYQAGAFESAAQNQRYLDMFSALLNYATLPFYWGSYEPRPDQPETARLAQMARSARAAGLETKGHPLIWHETPCPWWPEDPGAFEKTAEARVRRDVSQFAGLVDRWDVVNEAVVVERFDNAEARWMKQVGPPEAVTRALHWARTANPQAQLLVNDYRVDEDFVKLLRAVRQRGGEFDAIGLQSHMHTGVWSLTKTWEGCERFKEFGVPLHFTELTVLSGRLKASDDWSSFTPNWHTTAEGEAAQAESVEKLYTLLFSHPSVAAITWWDFSDHGAWQGAPAGLLRADLSPKPAYERLLNLIKGKWWTTLTSQPDRGGLVKFRGFCGEYLVTVTTPAGKTLRQPFRLARDQPARVNVTAP